MNDLQLEDIELPAAPGWFDLLWPIAPGWWLIIAFVMLVALLVILRRHYQHYHQPRVQALAQLNQLQPDSETPDAVILSALSRWFRQVVRHYCPLQDLSITGTQWVNTLNQLAPEPLSTAATKALTVDIYQSNPELTPQQWMDLKRFARQLLQQVSRTHSQHFFDRWFKRGRMQPA